MAMDDEGQPLVCLKGSLGDQRMEEEIATEELQEQIEKLSLAEQERRRVVKIDEDDIEEINREFSKATACKILANKHVNQEMFMEKMPKIWSLEGKMSIEKSGRNLYICRFRNQRDKNRVTKGGPWSFDSNLLLFEEPEGRISITELEFRYAYFWVHFHKLPRVCFCRKYAEALGNAIGTFEAVDMDAAGNIGGETLRVRIMVNISEPLKRGTNVRVGAGESNKWIKVTYEKLPHFCYRCGRIGHVHQECEAEDPEEDRLKNYGVEMRETQGSKCIYKNRHFSSQVDSFRGRGRGRGSGGRVRMDERYEPREEGRARNISEQDQEENSQDEVQSTASSRPDRWKEKYQTRERKE